MNDSALAKAKREWNYAAKLKASGFHDLEVGTGENLSSRGTLVTENHPDYATRAEQLESVEDASQELLRRKRWPSPFHKQVWELHCAGNSIHKIRAALGCGMQRACDAYLWCCEEAGIPTHGYRGKGDRRERRERRRKAERPARLVKKLGLRELLTVAETMRLGHE